VKTYEYVVLRDVSIKVVERECVTIMAMARR